MRKGNLRSAAFRTDWIFIQKKVSFLKFLEACFSFISVVSGIFFRHLFFNRHQTTLQKQRSSFITNHYIWKYFVCPLVDKWIFYHRGGQCTSLSISRVQKTKTCVFSNKFLFDLKKKTGIPVIFSPEMVDSYKWIGEKWKRKGIKKSIRTVN